MLKTQLLNSSHRRISAITIATGVALGLVAAAGISAAAPAEANVSGRTAVAESADLGAGRTEALAAVTAGRTALTDAAATVIAAGASGLDLGTESTAVETEGLLEALDSLEESDAAT